MHRNNRERVTMALDLLIAGMPGFVERQLETVYGDRWVQAARGSFRAERGRNGTTESTIQWDAHSLLTIMWDQWNRAFRTTLGHCERSLVSELREYRNQWAHQAEFNFDDTYRLLDSVERLLKAVDSPLAVRVRREKHDLMRSQFIREAKAAYRKSQIRRRTWQDLAIYFTCGAAIITVILQFFGTEAWVFAGFVVFVFGYLCYQRLYNHPPLVFGPHECGACRRIIYGETCPYCEDPPKLHEGCHEANAGDDKPAVAEESPACHRRDDKTTKRPSPSKQRAAVQQQPVASGS